jgi:cytochrome oxidase Cu insertion factor (SCO1/SenC/PrrC family)
MRLRDRIIILALLAVWITSGAFAGTIVMQTPAPVGSTTLKVGDPAPDFELPDQNNKKVRLSDFKGKKNVVLAYYVLAFTSG